MSTHEPKRLERVDTRSELTARLRAMRWPEPAPEARRRCWELLIPQVEALGGPRPAADEARPEPPFEQADELHERRLRRHEFAIQVCDGYAGALGARVTATRRPQRVRLR